MLHCEGWLLANERIQFGANTRIAERSSLGDFRERVGLASGSKLVALFGLPVANRLRLSCEFRKIAQFPNGAGDLNFGLRKSRASESDGNESGGKNELLHGSIFPVFACVTHWVKCSLVALAAKHSFCGGVGSTRSQINKAFSNQPIIAFALYKPFEPFPVRLPIQQLPWLA